MVLGVLIVGVRVPRVHPFRGEATLLRAPGALVPDPARRRHREPLPLNLVNKTSRDLPVELKLENVAGSLTVMGAGDLVLPREQLASTSVLIELAPGTMTGHNTKLKIGVYSGDKRLQTVTTVFIGPRDENSSQ